MRLLIKNIGTIVGIQPEGIERLCGEQMGRLETLDAAWLLAEEGRIAAFGSMAEGCPDAAEVVDAAGGMLFPSFCDSHTHLVYAGSREQEFLDKINGLSYEEIARRGGGILNSADRLHATSEEELYRQAMERIREIIRMGTGAVEIKSGYGLTTEDELKMLRVIRRIRQTAPLEVRATFLGAHAVGRAYVGRQAEYVDLICREMLPAVAREGLAEYVDVFCDQGFFTVEETARILETAARYGLVPKIHANELAVSGGVQVGVAHGDRGAARQPHDAHDAPRRRLLPRDELSARPRDAPRRSGCRAGFGLQPRLDPLGQHEDGPLAGHHSHEDDTGRGHQRRDAQRRLCHGAEPRRRLHHRGQAGQLLPHASHAFGRLLPLCLHHAARQPRLPARQGNSGVVFATAVTT